jgi:H+/Cl- antiporter ClcA
MKQNPLTLSRWVFLWAALGIICGLFASLYWIVLVWMTHHFEKVGGLSLLLVMPFAGFLVGLVIHLLGNPGEIGLIIDNIHLRGGRLAMRENPSMILSSLLSISSGGSAGPEAPMVQVTGSIGTWLGDRLQLQGEALRSISIAGMASGFTVLFGAPLGGAMFALEILHHQHSAQYYEAFLPAIVSSCAGYVVFVTITRLGIGPIWHFPHYQTPEIDDFALAILYGVVGAVVGWLFIIIFRGCDRAFTKLNLPIYWQTTLTGLGLGILAFLFPLTRYFGEHQLERVIEGNLSATKLLSLALAKMLAIAITVTGGWRGGIIIPLFFTGACVGNALADISGAVDSAFAAICIMAALNATVTRTPISTTILLSKLTSFSPLTPILFASLVGFFLAPRIPFIASQLKLEQTEQSSVDT